MHRPGYVQGGQEAKRGYLLLGVYHRRIPGFTVVELHIDKCIPCFLMSVSCTKKLRNN
jgi:hypothetical protein